MSDPANLERVRSISMFAELDDAALARVASAATAFDVPAGFVLVEHDQPGSGMFLLTEGTVSVEVAGGPIELGPGECVGELALLAEGITRTARVRAVTPVNGIAISRADFASLLREEPRIAVGLLSVLARRLADLERRMH